MGLASCIARTGVANVPFSRSRRQALAVLPVIFSMLCCNAAVEAKNWSINPGIALTETYTDNAAPGLAGGGGDESEFITQVNPNLQAELNGRRIQASLDYRMENIFYARNNEDNTYHQFLARASAEVLPEHFFLDVSSRQLQRNKSSNGVRINNNYTITGNRTDQLIASIRPSWYQPIGSYAEALLDYAHGIVRYKDVANANSRIDSTSLAIYSLSARRLSWKINTRMQYIDYDDNAVEDATLRNTGVLLGLRIIPSLSPLALIGYEDNDLGGRLTSTDPTGLYWGLGFSWQPNSRTELEALTGRRFFGNTYRINWRQRGRYLTSNLIYSEEINGEATSALEGFSSNLSLTNDFYISKTLRASAIFEKSRSTITITPYYEKRQFENSAEVETFSGITGSWEWAFAPRTTFTLTLHTDKTNDSDNASNDNETYSWFELLLERRLGKQTSASIEYSYTQQDSANKAFSYAENAISAQLSYRFGTPAKKTSESTPPRSRRQLKERKY